MNAATVKKSLRREFLAVRGDASAAAKEQLDRRLCESLTAYLLEFTPSVSGPPTVAIYNALGSEASLARVVDPLSNAGWRVAVPITDKSTKQLVFASVTKDTVWKKGALGISEPDLSHQAGVGSAVVHPAEVSVFCVPGLAFTRGGVRLGYGGGYYDRLFARPGVCGQRIGILFECQLAESLPCEDHDVRMHALATETGVREVRSK